MKFIDTIRAMFTPQGATAVTESKNPGKDTYQQGYEDYNWFIDWPGLTRSDGIIDFNSYKEAYKKHPTVVRCIQFRVDKMLDNGFDFEPVEGVANPKESNYRMLKDVFDNLDPDGVKSAYEIFYSSLCDQFRDGIKPVQIDNEYPYLYDNLDIATLKPRLNTNGLFKRDGLGQWIQIINGREVVRLDNEELIWLRLPDSVDLIFPQSPLEPLLVNIETDIFARSFSRQRFVNASNLGMVYVLPEGSQAKEAKTYLEFIRDNYISKRISFGKTDERDAKPIVLYGGTTVDKDFARNFGDFEFIKLKEVTDKDICAAFKVPPRLIGYETSGLGQAGANTEARNQFYQDVTWPDQALFEEQINKQFIRRRLKIYDWELKLKRPVAIDPVVEVRNRTNMVKSGVMLPREARSGLRPIYPELWEENDAEAESIATAVTESEAGITTATPERSCCDEVHTRSVATAKTKQYDVKAVERIMSGHEKMLSDRSEAAVLKMKDAAAKAISKLVAEKAFAKIASYSLPYKNEITSAFTNEGVATAISGSAFFKQMIGRRYTLNASDYDKLVRVEAKYAGEKIVISLESAIKTEVLSAVSRKVSENEVIGIIESVITKNLPVRETTYRTVTTKFYNEGILKSVYANKDFAPRVQYSAILDNRTSDRCSRLNNAIVSVDSAEFDRISPPQHFNCRSIWIPITTDDIEQNPGAYDPSKSSDVNKIIANTPGFEV